MEGGSFHSCHTTSADVLFGFAVVSVADRGGERRRREEEGRKNERRRREVGEIERREGTLNRGLGSRRGGGRDHSIKC